MRRAARPGIWATCVCVLTIATTSYVAGATLPTPWTNQDIGSVFAAGSASFAGGVFTVRGSGSDIWGTADSFQAVMQPIADDVQIVAQGQQACKPQTHSPKPASCFAVRSPLTRHM